jgi:hypothetical protein
VVLQSRTPPCHNSVAEETVENSFTLLLFFNTAKACICLFCRFASNRFPGDATLLQVLDLLRSDNKEVGDLRLCAFAAIGFGFVFVT